MLLHNFIPSAGPSPSVIGDFVPNQQLTMDYDTMDSDYK